MRSHILLLVMVLFCGSTAYSAAQEETSDPFSVAVTSRYYPAWTDPRDEQRADDLGFRDEGPAVSGEPVLLVQLKDDRPEPSDVDDALKCHPSDPGGELDLSKRIWRYCVPLDEEGLAVFRVPRDASVIVHTIEVLGPAEPDIEPGHSERGDCFYSIPSSHPHSNQVDVLVDRDMELDLPFGIQCRQDSTEENGAVGHSPAVGVLEVLPIVVVLLAAWRRE